MLLYFRDKLRLGKTSFSRGELSLILGLYGDHVKRGVWRDYAIDSLPEMAVFSVFTSARDKPAYQIAKKKNGGYAVFAGDKPLRESATLSGIIDFFTEKE